MEELSIKELIDELPIQEIREAIATYPIASALIGIALVVIIVILIKERKLKMVLTDLVGDIVKEERDKGVTVEIFVDDLKEKAIAKVKEKPDKTDPILLWLLNSKMLRIRVIGIITKVIEKLTAKEEEPLKEVITKPEPKEEPKEESSE